MSVYDAWNDMSRDTKEIVVELYRKYKRYDDDDAMDEIIAIFRNYGCSSATSSEVARVL